MSWKLFFDFMKDITPFVSAIVLFCMTTRHEASNSVKSLCRERLDKCYIPFYRLYCTGFLFELPFSMLTVENSEKFLNLLTDNVYLLDAESQFLYNEFYAAHINWVIAKENNVCNMLDYEQKLDLAFNKLKISIFSEYKHLLKQLRLPVPKI